MATITIPEDVRAQMRIHMRRQRGAAKLLVSETTLLANHAAGDLLFAENTGAHVFRIETADQLALQFLYSSPGTGTRVATVDLATMRPCDQRLGCCSTSTGRLRQLRLRSLIATIQAIQSQAAASLVIGSSTSFADS